MWPWQFDRRVRYLLEDNMDEDERIRFAIEGMDGQLIVALDERLLVVKPGFVREPNFGGVVASAYYSDVDGIEVRGSATNWAIKIHMPSYQINEDRAQTYQGNRVRQAKDFFWSTYPDTIPITRWALQKYRPYLYMIAELVGEAKETYSGSQ
jgi:hypothetical protein